MVLTAFICGTCGIQEKVEVTAFGVVKGEVEERAAARSCGINESRLVEAGMSLVGAVYGWGVLLRHQSEGDVGCRASEESDTCRICADS